MANIYDNGLDPALPGYKKQQTTTANPSATSLSSPAAQTFINSQVKQPQTPAPSAMSAPAASAPKSAYLEFLRKQFSAPDLEAANKSLMELNKRTSEELLRARSDEDRIRKNEIGQVESGLNYELGETARKSNRSLADLALAKGYAQDSFNTMLGAGKSLYEAEQDQLGFGSKLLAESAPAMAEELRNLPSKMEQDAYVRSKAAEMGVTIDQVNSALRAALESPAEDTTSSIKEYEYAKKNGFTGSYQQWLDRPSQYKGSSGSTSTEVEESESSSKATAYPKKMAGADGKVSPDTWFAAFNAWLDDGHSAEEFKARFGNYINKDYEGWENNYNF